MDLQKNTHAAKRVERKMSPWHSPRHMLTAAHSWRWCFYINLPPGAIVAALIFFSKIPEGQIVKPKAAEVVKDLHNRLDFVGFFLFAPSITMLLLAVQWGGNE